MWHGRHIVHTSTTRHPKWVSRGTHTQTRHRHKQTLLLGSCTALRRGQLCCSCCPQMSEGSTPAKRKESCRKGCRAMATPEPPVPVALRRPHKRTAALPADCRSALNETPERASSSTADATAAVVVASIDLHKAKRGQRRRRARACAGSRAPSRAAPERAPTTDPRDDICR